MVEITYWLYRPSLGWERHRPRRAAPREIEAASKLRLRVTDNPALVPLETLPGPKPLPLPGLRGAAMALEGAGCLPRLTIGIPHCDGPLAPVRLRGRFAMAGIASLKG